MADAQRIVDGLGGPDGIVGIGPCTTRLRAGVPDAALVGEGVLERAGAMAVWRKGGVLGVVVGAEADTIVSDIEDLLG